MRILRIIARLNVGGPARHVVWLSRELEDEEFTSRLIAGSVPGGEEDMGYLAEANGISPINIPEMSRELSIKDAVSLLKVFREIRRFKPDIVHTHTAKAGTIGRTAAFLYRWLGWRTLLGRPNKVRVVHTFHGHVFHSYYGTAKTRFFLFVERVLARLATDKIVTISPQQFSEIHETFRVGRRGQFEIIPLGIDLGPFADDGSFRKEFREELGASADELVVGFVGRLTEIKNIPLYLRVISLYRSSAAPGWPKLKFFIAGDGHCRDALEKESKELGVADHVTFLGNRPDVGKIYAGADVIALTSLNEGTPLSLIEAMAARRPVISTVVGGVKDLLGGIIEEKDGFYICERGIGVESNDARVFLGGLLHLAGNESLRKRLGCDGRAFVEAGYSTVRLVRDIKRLYRSLAG